MAKASADQGIAKLKLSEELQNWLLQYDWPGNIRELKNLAERVIMNSSGESDLTISDLPEEIQYSAAQTDRPTEVISQIAEVQDPDGPLRTLRAEFEKSIISQRLQKFSGNVTKTADSLGIERAHLHRKMRLFGIHASREAAPGDE